MLHEGEWNIGQIEKMTEQNAKDMALETLSIKGHTIYLVDFGGYFGYSALVFAAGRHIYYADDYELHHKYKALDDNGKGIPYTREELRELYISEMNNKLFTEAELVSPIKDYDDYHKRSTFLHNYYTMRRPYISIFGNCANEEERKEIRAKTEKMIYDPYAYAFYDPADKDFVEQHKKYVEALQTLINGLVDNIDYWKSAFLYEMFNHEYGINWQANYDVFSVFGTVRYDEYDDPESYMKQLKFSDNQKTAFWAARSEYYRKTADSL